MSASDPPPPIPPGQRVYAVGDVHGCRERLAEMHAEIARHDQASAPAEVTVVHLGDLVDRGPDSAGAVAAVMAGPPVPGAHHVVLMGNHERMMLDAVRGGDVDMAALWMQNGGDAALESWGVPRRARVQEWHTLIPRAVLDWMEALPLSHRIGETLFVHAGIRPGVPLAKQSAHDMLWIREPFLSWSDPLPVRVVHGHTPVRAPEIRPHRIGIDTGAVVGGRLTCAVLEGSTVAFIQV